jgi:asparagine synthase (glutamine-hydrolysing)
MCGINGFSFKDETLIKSMNSSLAHRGPDGISFYLDDSVSLGHARLSIIDLSEAATQPMFYSHNGRKICLIFNGEIYNYIELKLKLTKAGYSFSNSSDTEVLMAAYIEWGEKCVNELNGMWSFCIYDLDKNLLYCSRDRLGVKPFYYYSVDGKFIFSSELKAILKHKNLQINRLENINKDAVDLYFSMGFIPSPQTIYKNVNKLSAGCNLTYNLIEKKITKISSFFKIPEVKKKSNRGELIEEGKALLRDAVKLRMRSDVPVGAFLSGGLDSSTVVGEMRNFTDITNLHTYSIGFEEKKYDESYYIHLVKDYFQSKHHHHIYTQEDFKSAWSKYSNIFDEPFGDYSSFPSYSVCKMARENTTVVLSGDGGDEIFGGYPMYNTGYILEKLMKFPKFSRRIVLKFLDGIKKKESNIDKLAEVLRLSLNKKEEFYGNLFSDSRYKPDVYKKWSSEKLKNALEISGNDLSEALRIYDLLSNTLPDNFLVKVDRTSMANSIEVRSPFLDYRFIEYAEKIPNSLKVGFKNNKILMREIIKDIVPREIVERGKMGFTPPIYKWLDESISMEEFTRYKGYLKEINIGLYDFYDQLMSSGSKNFMNDLYKIKLTIFGKWLEFWILNESENEKLN